MCKQIPLIVIVGPTASSKTELSLRLAEKYNGEIISGDSMQVYRSLDIGTAKPEKSVLDKIPHHLIDILEPNEDFNVQDFVLRANAAMREISERGKLPIIVGGTGLYIDSLLQNTVFSAYGINPELRENLLARDKQELYNELQSIDPEYAAKLHPNNQKRVARAMEIYTMTGVTPTAHAAGQNLPEHPKHRLIIGLNFRLRELLYERINERVDIMLENGLEEEARRVLSLKLKTAGQAIGYKELTPYFEGSCSLPEAIENLKQNTRNYAKRQLTWFRRNENINWLYVDDYDKYDDLLQTAYRLADERLMTNEK